MLRLWQMPAEPNHNTMLLINILHPLLWIPSTPQIIDTRSKFDRNAIQIRSTLHESPIAILSELYSNCIEIRPKLNRNSIEILTTFYWGSVSEFYWDSNDGLSNIEPPSDDKSKIYRPSSVRWTSIENIEHLSKDVEPPPDEHLSNIYWKSSKSLSNVYRISVSLSLCLWLFSGSFWILSDPPAWLRRESRRMIKERHGGVAAVNVATDTFPLNQMPNGFERLYNGSVATDP